MNLTRKFADVLHERSPNKDPYIALCVCQLMQAGERRMKLGLVCYCVCVRVKIVSSVVLHSILKVILHYRNSYRFRYSSYYIFGVLSCYIVRLSMVK
jgi:hypothetical protein